MNKFILVLTIVLILYADHALAFRCNGKVIQVGDHIVDVLHKCGKPEYREERISHESQHYYPYRRDKTEEWIYNFGPRKFKQFLVFRNGILRRIEDLNYGH